MVSGPEYADDVVDVVDVALWMPKSVADSLGVDVARSGRDESWKN